MKIGLILGITLVATNLTFAADCALPSTDEIAKAFDVEMTNWMHSVREVERSVSLLMKRINKYGQSSRSEWAIQHGDEAEAERLRKKLRELTEML